MSESDDFEGQNIKTRVIDEKYKYVHKNPFWKITSFIVYRCIVMPFAFIYAKSKFNFKVIGKKKLKLAKKTGYFIFVNHTQPVLDTFIPTIVNFPKAAYIVAHPDNVSIPFLGKINEMLGALPLPSDIKSMKNFLDAIEHYSKKSVVAVYPEAHVWEYYTKIRQFPTTSFKYPAKLDKPSFAFTTTYQERKGNNPKVTLYIDGPFYPDKELKIKEAQEKLRDEVYETMVERSKESNTEYIEYRKVEVKSND